MSDSESDVHDNLEQIKEQIDEYKQNPETAGMFVSGWDDADVDVDLVKNPTANPKQHILHAAEHGQVEVVKRLLDQDPALVHVRDSDGYTPLHRAAYGNHVEVISCLLARGADVTARTELGWTPLHSAANWNNYNACDRLLHAGADVNALTDGKQTPLHLISAISHCRSTLVLLLTHPEIEPDLINASGETPNQLASAKGQYSPLFHMADPTVTFIKSKGFTENPYMRPEEY